MPSRFRQAGGFSLIELVMIVAIVGILSGMAIPSYFGYLDKAKIARCIAEIRYIEKSVNAFFYSSAVYPASLSEAGAGHMVDPWGTPYQYLKLAGAGPGNGGGQGGGGQGAGGGNTWWWFEPAAAYAAPPGGQGGGAQAGGNQGGGTSQGGGAQGSGGGQAGGAGSGQDGGNSGAQGGETQGGGPQPKPRKDRFLVPINSDYDLYSMGKDRESIAPLTAKKSHDDIVRANDGAFVGLASDF